MAGVDQLADSAVMLKCRFKVKPLEQWGIRRAYLRRLKYAFDQKGIEIPFPHLTVYPGAPNLIEASSGSAAS
ncbi:mechanosensitive ion channel family protein [Sulfurirhabdus autotrophica]|nr:mechanosensitive ion channel family protein [Sulfurirhabdus autotrophica]